MISAPH